MENKKEKFYGSYRGYVAIYFEIDAKDKNDAYDDFSSIPFSPSKDLNIVHISDIDWELDSGYVYTENDLNPCYFAPKKLSKELIKSALSQEQRYKDQQRKAKKEQIENQIKSAEDQLATTSQTIAKQISELKKQLEEI